MDDGGGVGGREEGQRREGGEGQVQQRRND